MSVTYFCVFCAFVLLVGPVLFICFISVISANPFCGSKSRVLRLQRPFTTFGEPLCCSSTLVAESRDFFLQHMSFFAALWCCLLIVHFAHFWIGASPCSSPAAAHWWQASFKGQPGVVLGSGLCGRSFRRGGWHIKLKALSLFSAGVVQVQ